MKRKKLLAAATVSAALGITRSGAATPPAPDPIQEVRASLTGMETQVRAWRAEASAAEQKIALAVREVADMKALLEASQGETRALKTQVDTLRRASLTATANNHRTPGKLNDETAKQLCAHMLLGFMRRYPGTIERESQDRLLPIISHTLGLGEPRAALTTTDVALPTQWPTEIRELINQFGVARSRMTHFPIGAGTAKPPRMKTRPAFAKIAMSGTIGELSPQIEQASLESHKIGGIVRIPREIDEQAMVPMGQFMAKYGAVEFARAEDTWAFLADGTATYEAVKGITKTAVDNAKNLQLAATKTKPSDATLADFRTMRTLVNSAALGLGAKYYMHSTWEGQLRTFNTSSDPFAYVPNAPGTRDAIGGPNLDGYPIVWTDVLQTFVTTAQVSKFLAVFGCLDYWWFGEHRNPRIDYSSDVYFTTDEIGARFLEEIDFDYMDVGATSSLQTAAS